MALDNTTAASLWYCSSKAVNLASALRALRRRCDLQSPAPLLVKRCRIGPTRLPRIKSYPGPLGGNEERNHTLTWNWTTSRTKAVRPVDQSAVVTDLSECGVTRYDVPRLPFGGSQNMNSAWLPLTRQIIILASLCPTRMHWDGTLSLCWHILPVITQEQYYCFLVQWDTKSSW